MPSSREPKSVTEAEDEAARAEARAEAARARAIRLRQLAEAASSERPDSRRRRLRGPGGKALAVGAATVLICASLVASGLILWQHVTMLRERQRAGEFTAAARQGVVTLMSIDANHAKDDFQRIIDNSTGQLRDQLQVTALDLANAVEQSKVSTKVTVNAVAIKSMTDDSAVVLVAAKSDLTGPDNKRQPALWRLSVNLERDGGRLKMSKVEFLQ